MTIGPNVARRAVGLPPYRGAKHKLFVAQTPGYGLSSVVFFQCHNCVANLAVERSLMEALLTGRGSSVSSLGLIIWGDCAGA